MAETIDKILSKLDPEDKEMLTRKIAESTEQLQRMAMIGEWTVEFAHNLGNMLLGGVTLRAEYALLHSDSEETKGYLRTIMECAHQISHQRQQLLSFVHEGRQQHQLVILDVYETIDQVVSLLENMVRKDIIIRKYFAGFDAYVTGDPIQIQDALLNLAINAINAMPKGGNLTFLAGAASKGYTKINVEDTGTGINEKDLPYIFEPFFTNSGGTGLGLASVKRIVKLHRGYIEVDSVPGNGTKFSVYLPLTKYTATNTEASHKRAPMTMPQSL